MACSTRSASSPPGPLPCRSVARHEARRSDLRGYLDARTSSSASPKRGGEILLVPNGSPFEAGKEDVRLRLVARARDRSRAADRLSQSGRRTGRTRVRWRLAGRECRRFASPGRCPPGKKSIAITDWTRRRATAGSARRANALAGESARNPSISAMMLGLRDYVNKNRFPGVVLGLSGGIDSALSAAVAVDALGAERVRCVMMPSRYTSKESLEDAAACAKLLGFPMRRSPIEAPSTPSTHAHAVVRRARRRHDGREHPVAHPRRDPDGDLQQVRPDGADHRQQVGDERRLCHALWRHVRRLQCAEGHLQDGGLRVVALAKPGDAAQCAGPAPASSFRSGSSPSRQRRSCAPTRRTRIRCRPTKSSTASSNAWSRRRCLRGGRRQGLSSGDREARRAAALRRRIQAPPGAAGRQDRLRAISAATAAIRSPTRSGMRDEIDRCVSSASHRRPPGCCMSAMRARPCSIISFAKKEGAQIPAAHRRHRYRAFEAGIRSGDRRRLAWLGIAHDLFARQIERADAHRAAAEKMKSAGRLYPCYETAARTGPQAQAPDRAQASRRSMIAPRCASPPRTAPSSKPGPQAALALQAVAEESQWRDLMRGEVEIDTAKLSDPGADPRGRPLSLHAAFRRRRCRFCRHATSSAARITSPTPRRRSKSSKRSAAPFPLSRISRCWSARAARRCPSVWVRSRSSLLREDGIEPMALELSRQDRHFRSNRAATRR